MEYSLMTIFYNIVNPKTDKIIDSFDSINDAREFIEDTDFIIEYQNIEGLDIDDINHIQKNGENKRYSYYYIATNKKTGAFIGSSELPIMLTGSINPLLLSNVHIQKKVIK